MCVGGGGGGEGSLTCSKGLIFLTSRHSHLYIPPVATVNSLPCFRMKRDIMIYHNIIVRMSLHEVDVLIRP